MRFGQREATKVQPWCRLTMEQDRNKRSVRSYPQLTEAIPLSPKKGHEIR